MADPYQAMAALVGVMASAQLTGRGRGGGRGRGRGRGRGGPSGGGGVLESQQGGAGGAFQPY